MQVTILAFGTTADGYQTCYAEGTPNPGTINCYWSAGAQMATAAVVPVVTVHDKLTARALAARSFTPVVIVAVWRVLGASKEATHHQAE